jgi:hypothetical protein
MLRIPLFVFSAVSVGLLSGFAGQALPASQMTSLDNGQVRVGMDLALGGAVTFISSKEHPANIINSADLGRQIQMSHYSGPWPFAPGDKKPRKEWAGLGWNPIQTGDCYGNPSRVVEHRNNGKEIYIKCIPMQWPLDDVPGDCVFETWTLLEGPVIHMRYRCTNQRSDKTVYPPCSQELPAVYTISKLGRLMSYTGDKPFTLAPLTQVTNDWRKPWPWTRFVASERWVALVGDDEWGLGVFKDDCGQFDGGIYGDARSADPKDGSTSYAAPIHVENFDYNIVYEHQTDFMVGKLTDIRKRFNAMATKTPPRWHFVHDRQHWAVRNATDQGFPLKGAWRVKFGTERPHLESAVQCWSAQDAPFLHLKVAYTGSAFAARVFWRRLDDDKFDEKKSRSMDLVPDTKFHVYNVKLAGSAEYRDLITGLAIEPVSQSHAGDELAIESVVLSASPK